MRLKAVWALVCLAGLLGLSSIAASTAAAESFCTDTWTGPSEGSWETASDWSAGKVPTSTDVACIGAGKKVEVGGGLHVAAVVQGEGTLYLYYGTLELTSLFEVSQVHNVEIWEGNLTGAGSLEVLTSLLWRSKSTLAGSGDLVISRGATAVMSKWESPRHTVNRSVINEGTMTLSEGANLEVGEGATLTNRGTFIQHGNVSVSAGEATFVNDGTVEASASGAVQISTRFENEGVLSSEGPEVDIWGFCASGPHAEWRQAKGTTVNLAEACSFNGGQWVGEGTLRFNGGSGSLSRLKSVNGSKGTARLEAPVELESGTTTIQSLTLGGFGKVSGAGNLDISGVFLWTSEGMITGSGVTTLEAGATGEICSHEHYVTYNMTIGSHTFVNDGTMTLTCEASRILETGKAVFENHGVFNANKNVSIGYKESEARFINYSKVRKTNDPAGKETTYVSVPFENYGTIKSESGAGKIEIEHMIAVDRKTKYGKRNKSALSALEANCADPVNCQTGNFYESQTDIAVGGRGVGLDLTRTYNAQAAAAGEHGTFGYGWTSSFNEHLTFNSEAHTVTVVQEEGSTVTFAEEGGKLVAPEWTQDELSGDSETGYTLTMNNQMVYKFTGTGALESVKDRNGNTTTLAYNEKGQLTTITDPAGRKIKLAYNGEGYVESATDPMGHVVKYAYESGNLTSVTMPGESSPRWSFKYDESHRMTSAENALGGETKNTYNSENQVTAQTDPTGATTKWEYEPFVTKVTEEATGTVTLDEYTSEYQLAAITHGYGTEHATTESWTYNERGEPVTRTDGRGYTTTYEYDSAGDKIAETDPEGHESKWTYNVHHQVTSEANPSGETTSTEYDEHGNPIKVSRPAPEEHTQITRYEYNADGEMAAMIDPLERKWSYGYDEAGDRVSEIDPEGDETTWGYNEDSQQTSEVSPAGNVEGGKPAEYTTSTERNAQGLPVKVTQPEGQETLYEYNADGDQISVTDPNGHKTTTTYNSEDQPIKTTEPSGATQETEYNGAGEIVAQIDGDKHTTKYVRNVLGEVTEVINPLEQKTTETYDADGDQATIKDAAGRTSTYSYNEQDQPTKIAYSEEATPTVEYEYNSDGQVLSMKDGTGTTSYSYNQLGELTETKDGHGDKASYAYDLAGEVTQITYPNGKTVKDSYDKAGRLSSLTDWLSHTISFAYDPDSQPITETFPEASGETDHYSYNRNGQQSEAKMLKGSETLASIAYKRDNDGQVTKETQTGLPGEASVEYTYTSNEQLESAGSTGWEYDAAGNPTKDAGATATFNAGDELTKDGSTSYSYNEVGQRTKATPETGPATTYGYNQAGNLTSVKRPEEGSTPKIEDSYTYDGNGLRASETIGSETKHLTWQLTGSLPLLLSDGTNSYIYGPQETPVEQINSEEHATYLHHDQQDSTRLLTSESGEATGSYTYGPYGEKAGHTGTATTPLGYDGQYTSSDTGLIYLDARSYDPATGQFLSVDPAVASTGTPYIYTNDNPTTYADRSGLALEEISGPCWWCGVIPVPPPAVREAIAKGIEEGANAASKYVTANASEDEGESELHAAEAEAKEAACKLVELDKAGRVKGDLPTHPPADWTQEELEQAEEDLRASIDKRREQMDERGEEGKHRDRLREEEKLLRQIGKKLGGS